MKHRQLALLGPDLVHWMFLVTEYQKTWVSRETDSQKDSYNLLAAETHSLMGVGLTSKASFFFIIIKRLDTLPKDIALRFLVFKKLERVKALNISLPIVQNAVGRLVYPQSLWNL